MALSLASLTKLGSVAFLSMAVAACTGTGNVRPLSFAPVSAPRVADSDAILASLNGGVLPADAASGLTRSERTRALEAEYEALEKAPLGQRIAWKSQTSAASGEVTAGTPYQVGQQNCRQYTHTATIRGTPVKGQGAACRNGDGSWTPLS